MMVKKEPRAKRKREETGAKNAKKVQQYVYQNREARQRLQPRTAKWLQTRVNTCLAFLIFSLNLLAVIAQ